MGYKKNADGSYVEMSRKCVDTGMGIERTTAILRAVGLRPGLRPIIAEIERLLSAMGMTKRYLHQDPRDHVRTSVFILGDQEMAPQRQPGVISPPDHQSGPPQAQARHRAFLAARPIVFDCTANRTPSCRTGSSCSRSWRRRGEVSRRPREREFEDLPNLLKGKDRIISGRTAFKLYGTGYPLELAAELAGEPAAPSMRRASMPL